METEGEVPGLEQEGLSKPQAGNEDAHAQNTTHTLKARNTFVQRPRAALENFARNAATKTTEFVKKIDEKAPEIAWELNKNDLAQVLLDANIPNEKVDAALEIIKWFEVNTKDYTHKYDRREYRSYTEKGPYHFKLDDRESLKDFVDIVEDPLGFFLAVKQISDIDIALPQFCSLFSKIGSLPEATNVIRKLGAINGLSNINLSLLTLKEDNDNWRIIDLGSGTDYDNPPEDIISTLSRLPEDERSKLLNDDSIGQVNAFIETLPKKNGSTQKIPSQTVLQLLKLTTVPHGMELLSSLVQQPSIKNHVEYSEIQKYTASLMWLERELPEFIELYKTGFDIKPYLNRIYENDRFRDKDDKIISYKLEEKEGKSRLREIFYQDIDTFRKIKNDTVFCQNATTIHEELGIRLDPYYHVNYNNKQREPRFYEYASPESVQKAVIFFRDHGALFGLSKEPATYPKQFASDPTPFLQLDKSYLFLEQTLSPYSTEQLREIMSGIPKDAFSHLIENLPWEQTQSTTRNIMQSVFADPATAHEKLLLLSSDRMKTAISEADWLLRLFSTMYIDTPRQVPPTPLQQLLTSLLEGNTIEENLTKLEALTTNKVGLEHAFSKFKEVGAKLETRSVDILWNLSQVTSERMDKIIGLFNGYKKYNPWQEFDSTITEKTLALSLLTDEQIRKAEALISVEEPFLLSSFLAAGFETTSVRRFVENIDTITTTLEQVKQKLGKRAIKLDVSFSGFQNTVEGLLAIQNEPRILDIAKQLDNIYYFHIDEAAYLKELVDSPTTITCINTLVSDTKYRFLPEDTQALKEVASDPLLLQTILKLGAAGYKFKSEDKQFLTQVGNDDKTVSLIQDLGALGYYFQAKDCAALRNLTSQREAFLLAAANENTSNLLFNNLEVFENISPTNFEGFLKALTHISNSPSKEVQKIKVPLLRELASFPDPEAAWLQIKSVFERNNLPLAGKILRVFEILHPAATFDAKIQAESDGSDLSPTLLETTDIQERYKIIAQDILKVHLRTGNRSLRNYMDVMAAGDEVFTKAESEGIEHLSAAEQQQLNIFLNKMDSLYFNAIRARGKPITQIRTQGRTDQEILHTRMRALKRRFGVHEEETFEHKVSELFLAPLGVSNLEDAQQLMKDSKSEADMRNRETLVAEQLILKPGDLLKGVKFEFLQDQMQNGIVSNEFFGNESDRTPFDTDTSRVMSQDLGGSTHADQFKSIIDNSLSKGYGDIILVSRNRGQFRETARTPYQKGLTPGAEQIDTKEKERYELFASRNRGDKHWGIRTGIPFTEIDAIVLHKDEFKSDEKKVGLLKFSVAQNGFYIPIVDKDGMLMFTEEEYEQYRFNEETLKRTLSSNANSTTLISELRKNPYLGRLFETDAGVKEEWTIEQHTGMVLNQFDKYFSSSFNSPLISNEVFRLVLSLHDIGKGLGYAETGLTSVQHEYTRKIAEPLFNALGYSDAVQNIAVAIVSQDYIGQFMQGKIDQGTAARSIRSKADELGVDAKELFDLLTTYYLTDASSYTENASYTDSSGQEHQGKPSLDRLFNFDDTITLTSEPKQQFLLLKNDIEEIDQVPLAA